VVDEYAAQIYGKNTVEFEKMIKVANGHPPSLLSLAPNAGEKP